MLKIYQLRLKQNTFEVTLKYKGVGVRVAFIDGNTYNGTPARCYTNNTFKQRAIENSQMFKDNDIVLERQVEEESDRKAAAAKAAAQQKRMQKANTVSQSKPTTATAANDPTPAKAADDTTTDDSNGMEKKTFDNLAEAIMYIATTYQVQVQTASEARNFLKEKGIKATIKQG